MAVWSIVNFAQLKSDTRIDPEYYQPYFLKFESLLKTSGFPVVNLGYLVKEGYRVVYENTKIIDEEFDPKYHVKFLQAADILNSFPAIEQSSIGWVNRSDWNRYPQGHIRHGEILIEVKGKAEKVVMVPDDFPLEILITGTLYKMLIDEEKINRYYVFVYLLSKLGRSFRDRGKTNTLISYVNKDDLYSIPIPIIPKQIQFEIAEAYHTAYSSYEDALSLYAEAEALLLHELGVDKLDLSTQKSYVANFSDTVDSHRLDAEYYNPKYTVLINYLHNIAHSKLGYLASFSNGATPSGAKYLDEGIPFIRIQNVTKNRLDLDDVVYIDKKIHNSILKRSQLQPGDVLITITGRIGTAAVIPDSLLFANMNQHSVRLRIHNAQINPYYLSVFLNSKAGLLQTDREAYGATRDALPYYCLEKIIIPIASLDLQKQVEVKIREAEKTLQEAKTLLERAKHQVEQIILGG